MMEFDTTPFWLAETADLTINIKMPDFDSQVANVRSWLIFIYFLDVVAYKEFC